MKASDVQPVRPWLSASVSGNCVEVAPLADGTIGIRNSREPEGDVLIFTKAEMEAFVHGAAAGIFNHLI